jgi:hypothetical protein
MPDAVLPAVLVPSSLFNLQLLLEDLSGPQAGALLGAVWDVGAFAPDAPALAEYDLPISWGRYTHLLAAFAGVKLEHHPSDDGDDAYDRLDLGQSVVLAVDSHDLPYRPAFGRVHSARTIVATRINRAAGTADIVDAWMPTHRGTVDLTDLDRARASDVPHDIGREPLYAGTPLRRRWWTLALIADPLVARPEGVTQALTFLTVQAVGEPNHPTPPEALDEMRRAAAAALFAPLPDSQAARRAAALRLRSEIGLRAYLVTFLRVAARLLDDALLAAEVEGWSTHLADLARGRDILVKSVVSDRALYANLVDRSLANAINRERRFVRFLSDLYGQEHTRRVGRKPC